MSDGDAPTLKLSEVSRRSGIGVDVLRQLIDDDQLAGVVRATNGHVYLREDQVPTWHDIVVVLEAQSVRHLQAAQAALRRVRAEMEAVENDLALALENPRAELGDDLVSLHLARTGDGSSLTSALRRLEAAVWRARTYNDALRQSRTGPLKVELPDRLA